MLQGIRKLVHLYDIWIGKYLPLPYMLHIHSSLRSENTLYGNEVFYRVKKSFRESLKLFFRVLLLSLKYNLILMDKSKLILSSLLNILIGTYVLFQLTDLL